MKISYNWINTLLGEKLPLPEKVRDAVTMTSFEIESLDKEGNDFIFDVKILPNRAHDCLSHYGFAKELSALFDLAITKEISEANALESKLLKVNIEKPELCKRYSYAVIKNVSINDSPEWLKERLAVLGQKSINNIVDATNYVMFLLGQPMHAFDLDKMTKKDDVCAINVRISKEGEDIITLDNKRYELPENTLLITDGNSDEVLGIAGIKGGKKAEIYSNTKNIILESASFDASNIRKSSQKLGLRTDASYRFEHELSSLLTSYALKEAIDIILEIAGGELEEIGDVYPVKEEKRLVKLLTERTSSVMGCSINTSEIENILRKLKFSYKKISVDEFEIEAPFERLDITIEEDLIEEVGRIYGLENIKPVPLLAFGKKISINKNLFYGDKIRKNLSDKGFSEVMTYAFTNKGDIEVVYSAASNKTHLRKNLHESISECLDMNFRNIDLLGLNQIKIFEIGKVFSKEGECLSLCVGIVNPKSFKGLKAGEEMEQVKKNISEILGVDVAEYMVKEDDKKNILKSYVEFNLEKMIGNASVPLEYETREIRDTVQRYKSISHYPFIVRDVAVFVPSDVAQAEVAEAIKSQAGNMVEIMRLFDVFNKNMLDGTVMTSYAWRIVFQSHEKTLTDEEINPIMEKITRELNARDGWKVR